MAVRSEFKTNATVRRFIFEYLVLKLLVAIYWQVSGQRKRAEDMIGFDFVTIVDYVEANSINPESTRETIKRSFGLDP